LSFSLVLGTGILLLLLLLSSARAWGLWKDSWNLNFLGRVCFGIGRILSFVRVITLLLAAIFRLLPDTEIAWNDVWIGAAIASLLLRPARF